MSDRPKITYTPPGGSLTTITFDYPPQGDDYKDKRLRAVGNVNTSASGQVQYTTNHIQEERFLRFSHVSTAIKDEVETFFTTHMALGREFDYFEDKDGATNGTFTISNQQGRQLRVTPMGSTWRFDIRIRRVAA